MTTPTPEPYVGVGQNYEPGPFDPTVPAPSWGVPLSQTTAVQSSASSAYASATSLLQQMLSVSGLTVPAEQMAQADYMPPAPTGGDSFTKGFLTGVDPQMQAQARALGQSIPQDITDDRVYMGHMDTTQVADPQHIGLPGATDAELASPTTTETKHKTTTVQAALSQPYLWSDTKVAETMKKMREAGINVTSFEDMMGAWSNLVTRASRTFVLSGGDNLVTPWDMLAATKKESVANGTLDKNGNIVSVTHGTSVNDLTEGQAWSTLRGTMQQMLGRDPSDQEVRDFLSAANADASRDPSHTVTTSRTDTQTGNTTSNTVTHGGYTTDDAAQSAYDQLHDTADYGKYQSSTTYFNALVSALGEVAGSA